MSVDLDHSLRFISSLRPSCSRPAPPEEDLTRRVCTVLTYRQRACQKPGMSKSSKLLTAVTH